MDNFCNQCGNKLFSNAKFCSDCGKQISSNVANTSDAKSLTSKNSKKSLKLGKFFVFFIPGFFIMIIFADIFEIFRIELIGLNPMIVLGIIGLITALLYQRYFNERSWYSIFWGKDK